MPARRLLEGDIDISADGSTLMSDALSFILNTRRLKWTPRNSQSALSGFRI